MVAAEDVRQIPAQAVVGYVSRRPLAAAINSSKRHRRWSSESRPGVTRRDSSAMGTISLSVGSARPCSKMTVILGTKTHCSHYVKVSVS